jgi:carbamoyl-phosphate synthase small subunit
MIDATLTLEDGTSFFGRRFGAEGEVGGEVVFNTAMSGYQEVLGDPSYARQMVVMTYPMMGNYGIAPQDFESTRCHAKALIVKEPSRIASNWRHEQTLAAFLQAHNVVGLCELDTRALVRHLREHGVQRGLISDASTPEALRLERTRAVPSITGIDLTCEVSTKTPYTWDKPSPLAPKPAPLPLGQKPWHVVVLDFGVKQNILRRLVDVGCRVTVLPAATSAEDVWRYKPDGVLLSNGPGDPEPVTQGIKTIRALLGRTPLFGICLGHQLMALALGGKSYKLKYGHRGANHPVMDLSTRRVAITSQNHGFSIDIDSLPQDAFEVTHINLNDQTLAGFRLKAYPAFCVQYHPEAAPGPQDAAYLFERFVGMMQAQA